MIDYSQKKMAKDKQMTVMHVENFSIVQRMRTQYEERVPTGGNRVRYSPYSHCFKSHMNTKLHNCNMREGLGQSHVSFPVCNSLPSPIVMRELHPVMDRNRCRYPQPNIRRTLGNHVEE